MKLTGFLLWIGMSTLVWYVGTIIFRFSIFQKEYWNFGKVRVKVADMKLVVLITLSEIVMISYIRINTVLGIFGYFGIFLYPLEDGILSGLLVSGGSDFIYQIYKTIINYKDLLNAKKELFEKAGGKNEVGK